MQPLKWYQNILTREINGIVDCWETGNTDFGKPIIMYWVTAADGKEYACAINDEPKSPSFADTVNLQVQRFPTILNSMKWPNLFSKIKDYEITGKGTPWYQIKTAKS